MKTRSKQRKRKQTMRGGLSPLAMFGIGIAVIGSLVLSIEPVSEWGSKYYDKYNDLAEKNAH